MRSLCKQHIPDRWASKAESQVSRYRDGLLEDVLPFWLSHGLDLDCGGYFTCLDADGSLVDSDKCIWQQGRFAWLLSKLFNELPTSQLSTTTHDQLLDAARIGIDFLESYGFDPKDGRMWFHVTQEGIPIRKRRYAFSESFAAIAFAQYSKATQSDRHAQLAKQCFEAFLQQQLHPSQDDHKFEVTRPAKSIGTPMIAIVTAQELRDTLGMEELTQQIAGWILEIERDFVDREQQVVFETVGMDGGKLDHFDGRTLNPGHAIEAAWFIMREAIAQNREDWLQLGCAMTRWMFDRGWDSEYGGLKYFVSVDGGPVQEYWHDMKFWWCHAEALLATLMAAVYSGDPTLWERYERIEEWTYRHFPDPTHGEWFGYLHQDGSKSSTLKGNLWKGPFHIPRMQWECWQLWGKIAEVCQC